MRRRLALILVCLGATACGPTTSASNEQIQAAVQETLSAIPTQVASPSSVPPTTVPLKGLFCEYEFCIGHPAGMAYFDVVAKQEPLSAKASTFDAGDLAAYNSSLFLEVKWQGAPTGSDGQFMLDVILAPQVDTRSGDVQPIIFRDLNLYYVAIASTASPALSYGGAAAWVCGGRAFGWKTYAMQPDLAKGLLMDALQDFRCD